MKPHRKPYPTLKLFAQPGDLLMIQAPLPDFADTLPILLSVRGQGTARERAAPLAPPREPANDT